MDQSNITVPVDEKIVRAIENAVAMIRPNCKADDALKFSQATLNLAHAQTLLIKGSTRTGGRTSAAKNMA